MQIHHDKRFQTLITQMEEYMLQGNGDAMKPVLEQLQTLAETEQDDIGLAAAYFYRDVLFSGEPGSDSYMQYAKRALLISRTKNVPYYQMKASNSLGIMYSELSDFHTSLEYYMGAIHIAEEHPEFSYASVVLNNLGNLFSWLEDYEEAATYLRRAYYKAIVENQDDLQLIALVILNLIELYSSLEKYDEVRKWEKESALYPFQEALEIIAGLAVINKARQLVKKRKMEAAKEELRTFAELRARESDYVYSLRSCISALRVGIQTGDFPLCLQLVEKMDRVQERTTLTSFAYDYATVRVEYYQAFRAQLAGKEHDYYEDYYKQSQIRLAQLRNTYARSLSVKIALEEMKDENKTVHLQNEQLQRDMERDIFTNLYNKVSTEKYVRKALEARGPQEIQGLLLIDIDLFKRINDNYGHGFGDQVITKVAETMEAIDSVPKIAGRFGGDEFLVFVDRQTSPAVVREVAQQLLSRVHSCIALPDDRVKEITLSIGICIVDSDLGFEAAFAQADAALYRAKELGRNRCEE